MLSGQERRTWTRDKKEQGGRLEWVGSGQPREERTSRRRRGHLGQGGRGSGRMTVAIGFIHSYLRKPHPLWSL